MAVLQGLFNLITGSLQTALVLNAPLVLGVLSSPQTTSVATQQTTSAGPSAGLGGLAGLTSLLGLLGGPRMSCRMVDTRTKSLVGDPGLIIPLPFTTANANGMSNNGFGYTSPNGNVVVHSVLTGRAADMMNITKEDSDFIDHEFEQYSFKSIVLLARDLLHSAFDDVEVKKSIECQMQSFECTLANREIENKLEQCSKQLCSCMSALYEK